MANACSPTLAERAVRNAVFSETTAPLEYLTRYQSQAPGLRIYEAHAGLEEPVAHRPAEAAGTAGARGPPGGFGPSQEILDV